MWKLDQLTLSLVKRLHKAYDARLNALDNATVLCPVDGRVHKKPQNHHYRSILRPFHRVPGKSITGMRAHQSPMNRHWLVSNSRPADL